MFTTEQIKTEIKKLAAAQKKHQNHPDRYSQEYAKQSSWQVTARKNTIKMRGILMYYAFIRGKSLESTEKYLYDVTNNFKLMYADPKRYSLLSHRNSDQGSAMLEARHIFDMNDKESLTAFNEWVKVHNNVIKE